MMQNKSGVTGMDATKTTKRMKSTEEKAKCYDEAKARMSKAYNDNRCTIGFMNEIFPELKESEDERIRKALLEMVHDTTGDSLWVDYNVHKEDAIAWLEKQGEHKPAWSEEDEARFESCIKVLQTSDGYNTINAKWFKSLKDRAQPLPKQEWSEEDLTKLKSAITLLEHPAVISYNTEIQEKTIDFLKSLRERYTWKPSDEQMLALADAIETYCGKYKATLTSFYNVLKKLTK